MLRFTIIFVNIIVLAQVLAFVQRINTKVDSIDLTQKRIEQVLQAK